MRGKYISALLMSVVVTATYAAPPEKPPPEPQDVKVVNDVTNPVPVVIQSNAISPFARYQFSGFSADIVRGDAGMLGMNSACQATYDTNARMCNSKEIAQSTTLTSQPGLIGWVHPFLVGAGSSTETDYMGTTRPTASSFSCSGWSVGYVEKNGLVLDGEKMTFLGLSCNNSAPVACCTPQ